MRDLFAVLQLREVILVGQLVIKLSRHKPDQRPILGVYVEGPTPGGSSELFLVPMGGALWESETAPELTPRLYPRESGNS